MAHVDCGRWWFRHRSCGWARDGLSAAQSVGHILTCALQEHGPRSIVSQLAAFTPSTDYALYRSLAFEGESAMLYPQPCDSMNQAPQKDLMSYLRRASTAPSAGALAYTCKWSCRQPRRRRVNDRLQQTLLLRSDHRVARLAFWPNLPIHRQRDLRFPSETACEVRLSSTIRGTHKIKWETLRTTFLDAHGEELCSRQPGAIDHTGCSGGSTCCRRLGGISDRDRCWQHH